VAHAYGPDEVKAAKSVLAELTGLLGDFEKDLVLIGGWAPYFHTRDASGLSEHIGSADVDLAVNIATLKEDVYEKIVDILKEEGYREHHDDKGRLVAFRYDRDVQVASGRTLTVWVDFLAPEYVTGGRGRNRRHQRKQDLAALKEPGVDLAFRDAVPCTFRARLPNGSEREVTIRMAGVASCIAMKAITFGRRHKTKHAYDLYMLLRRYPGGVPAIAAKVKLLAGDRTVRKALATLAKEFESPVAPGPVAVGEFLGIAGEERDIVVRSAFEMMRSLLDAI
jgi:hypothetical protein